jgi:hypothetical protein
MAVINRPPEDVRLCGIYKRLLEISTDIDGCAERVNQFVRVATPLLDLVLAGPFKDYTLHNRDHAKKLIHLAEYVMDPDTLARLSPLECQTLICSAYLHDLGMSLTSIEKERILNDPDFLEEFRGSSELWGAYNQACKRIDEIARFQKDEQLKIAERLLVETEIFQLHEAALCAYLRPRHATPERYRELIAALKRTSKRPDLLEVNGVSFEDYLININSSHNQDVGVLAEVYGTYEARFPTDLLIGGQRFNTQFIAAVLRIADIMDFDRERTPRILFESLGIYSLSLPGSDVTLREWQKHMAVHDIEITQDEIIVSCECQHPAIEKTIRDFCQIIEREIRDTIAVIRHNPPTIAEQYRLQVPISVRPRIKSKDYIYKDISLQLNQAAITSLLMGERLYSNPAAAIRELIQNSIDACAARQKIQPPAKYEPMISVSLTEDQTHRHWIEVSDNGIGMDEHVLAEYFLQLGNSYYGSPEFERIYRQAGAAQPFMPIAKFGIGILSVFMIADTLEVITRCSCSPRLDDKSRLVRIERMGGLAFMAASSSEQYGTCLRIRLKPEIDAHYVTFATDACSYLKEVVVRPAYDITIRLTEDPFILSSAPKVSLKPNIEASLSQNRIKPIVIDLQRWSDRLSGAIILFFSVNSDGTLSHLSSVNRPLRVTQKLGPNTIDPNSLLDNYRGNRITVNGFRMTLKKILRIYRRYIAAVLDIDFVGDKDIEYEVSRDKIAGQGALYVRNSIRSATLRALSEMGILDSMAPETRGLITDLMQVETPWTRDRDIQHDIEPGILDKVAQLIPKGRWPPMLDKKIARELNISNTLAARAIHQLIIRGTIQKPVAWHPKNSTNTQSNTTSQNSSNN